MKHTLSDQEFAGKWDGFRLTSLKLEREYLVAVGRWDFRQAGNRIRDLRYDPHAQRRIIHVHIGRDTRHTD